MNWPLAVVIVAVLFFGYAYTASRASDDMDRATDEAALYQRCYGAGYEAAVFGDEPTPPQEGKKCADWFEAGFSEGRIVSGGR